MAAEGPGLVHPGREAALEDPIAASAYKEATEEMPPASLRRCMAGGGETVGIN